LKRREHVATFATRLKELRGKSGLSQPQLAQEIGVTKQTISLWERGPRRPDFPTMESLADYFNVQLSYLIGESDDSSSPSEPDYAGAAKEFTEEDDRELEHMTSLLAQLSYDSRRIVAATLAEAYRLDREKGNLQPADAHEISVRTKWLDDDNEKSDA